MSTETTKAIARRYAEAIATSTLEQINPILDDLLVADYIHHDANLPPNLQRGLANYKQGVAMFYTAFPDLRATVDDLFAEGDRAVARFTWRGTYQNELMGIPPTGKTVSFTMIAILRVDNGKIVEGWVNFDALTIMQQLGVVPH